MDSFRFHDIKAEKAKATAKYRRVQRLTTLFRYVELFVFLIVLSRFSTQFAFSFNLSTDYFRGISLALISPKSVFVIGNAIVIALFLISGQFSKKGENTTDIYDQYVEKCRINNQNTWRKEVERESDTCKYSVCSDEKVLRRVHSSVEKTVDQERRRDLRRSMSEKCRKSVVKAAAVAGGGSAKAEEEMSSEEFRRTVEAFIARQQRCLREEEEFS